MEHPIHVIGGKSREALFPAAKPFSCIYPKVSDEDLRAALERAAISPTDHKVIDASISKLREIVNGGVRIERHGPRHAIYNASEELVIRAAKLGWGIPAVTTTATAKPCTCPCHAEPGITHIRACCHPCPKCGLNILDGKAQFHADECEGRQDLKGRENMKVGEVEIGREFLRKPR